MTSVKYVKTVKKCFSRLMKSYRENIEKFVLFYTQNTNFTAFLLPIWH